MNRLVIILLMLAGFILHSCEEKQRHTQPYLLLVSMDAFRWDYPEMYTTPILDSIASVGVKAKAIQSCYPTKTFPNHYSIATGLYPDHHGIVNNSFYDAEMDRVYKIRDRSAVEDGAFYGGEPIWVSCEKQGVTAASFFWVGSEADVQGVRPTYWKRYTKKISFEQRIDTVVSWFSLPYNKRPKFTTLYFHQPDGVGHKYGPKHDSTRATVEYLDALIGNLYSKLRKLDIYDSLNIIVTSDHGMGEISRDRLVVLGDHIDTSMVEMTMGSNSVYNLKIKEGFVDAVYSKLKMVEHVQVFKPEEIPAYLNYGSHSRITDLHVVADSSWSVFYVKGKRYYDFGGTHGYDNTNPDMDAIFYGSGPAFKRNYRSEKFNNVDLYNLMCKMLNIRPALNDGDTSIVYQMLR